MSIKQLKAIKFSLSSAHDANKYFLFGDEHILIYQARKNCLKNLDINLLEKYFLSNI